MQFKGHTRTVSYLVLIHRVWVVPEPDCSISTCRPSITKKHVGNRISTAAVRSNLHSLIIFIHSFIHSFNSPGPETQVRKPILARRTLLSPCLNRPSFLSCLVSSPSPSLSYEIHTRPGLSNQHRISPLSRLPWSSRNLVVSDSRPQVRDQDRPGSSDTAVGVSLLRSPPCVGPSFTRILADYPGESSGGTQRSFLLPDRPQRDCHLCSVEHTTVKP